MKLHMFVLFLALVVGGIASTATAQSVNLTNGLAGYWKFDSISNLTTPDESGTGNVGAVGTSSRLVSGKFGQALRFDLGGRWQHMTTAQNFSASNWTISAWVNPDRPFITSSPYFGNFVVFSGTANEALTISRTGVQYFRTKIADYNFETNTGWRHVALTFNGSTLSAYVDGVKRGSIATTTNMLAGNTKRLVGTLGQGNYGHVFVGAIDEVRLYSRVVSDAEIGALFTGAPSTAPSPTTTQTATAPTTKFTQNLVITTDKTNYRLGENITMTATFTPAPEWVQYLRANNIAQGEIKFRATDSGSKFLMEKTFAFDLVSNPIRQQYVWATPVTATLAGSRFTIEASVYDAQKTVTESKITPTLSFEAAALTSIVVSPDVITSRLPAGVSPYLYGKITAERDITNEFTTPVPFTFTKTTSASQVGNMWFTAKNNVLDLSAYNGLWLVVENQGNTDININVLPFKNGATDNQHAVWSSFPIPAQSGQRHILVSLVDPTTTIYRCDLQNGMQRCPVGPDQIPPLTQDKASSFASFTRDQFGRLRIYLRDMPSGERFVVHSVRAVNINYRPDSLVGFVDRWGQNNWTNFNQKITSDDQLRAAGQRESSTLNPLPANWDTYGGDTRYGGYTGTGFFKTEKVDGKWWLVSPSGNLFYAKGQNWVTNRTWATSLKNRAQMFSGIPAQADKYTSTYETAQCQPTNINISGTGEFCGGQMWFPYFANIITKYSTNTNTNADILTKWGTVTRNRLYDWGFNSVKTTGVAPHNMRITYTLLPNISSRTGVVKIPGTNVPDVFSPTFRSTADSFVNTFANQWNQLPGLNLKTPQDPYNIGVFSDNEIYFGRGTGMGTLAETYYIVFRVLQLDGTTSAAKNAFTNKLREKYGTFSAIKSAWGTSLSNVNSWEEFNTRPVSGAIQADLSLLLRYYSDEYFRTSREVIKKYYPNHLFLGSRFAGFHRTPNEAFDSCAQYCDVISFNYYKPEIDTTEWRYLLSLDKPILITEFHIGMLARGAAFGGHNWLFGEDAGAAQYAEYVRSALRQAPIVGYYYHSYVDMPISGINFEAENMYASFVTTTDIPKTAMVNAAKDVNSRVYSMRGARPNSGTTNYTLSVGTTGTGSGSVSATGIACGADCTEVYSSGTTVTLTASSSSGATFTGWGGACTGSGVCTLSMTQDRVVSAEFTRGNTAPVTQPVTVRTRGAAVTINYVATDPEGDAITYNNGVAPTQGTLTRVSEGRYTYTPNTPLPSIPYTDGYNYNATDGSLTSPATRVTIEYTPPQYVLSVSKTGSGTVTGTNINCGIDCSESMNIGLSNTLTATPATGHTFTGWSGACTGTGTCTVTMTQDRAVTANFVVTNVAPVAQSASYTTTGAAFDITLTANDVDPVTFTPSTLGTPLATLARLREGVYRYTLKTPLPTVRSTDTFTFTASDGRLTSAPATVTVVFTPTPPTQFSLNTSVVGLGSVTGTGINCGTDCTETVNTGTTIALTARPATGYTFSGWTGACTNTTGTCSVLVNADKSVTARFTVIPPADGDRDGVPDITDRCRQTPDSLRTQVNAFGCVRPRMTRFDIRPNVEGDITAVNNVELGITSVGKIRFEQPVTLGRPDGVVDIDAHVIIEKEKVEIRSAVVPELNKPSIITMYGVTKNNPRILKDGQECNSPQCNIQSYENGVLVFTVAGFSTYTLDEIPVVVAEPERRRRSGGGGGGGSRTTVTPTISNETLIQQLTAQLNFLIAQLNALTGSRTPVVTTGTSFNVTLALGSRHPDVKRLQQKLTSLGYTVPATGYYGPQTVAAVKKFQAARGIKQTGTAGALTRAQLNR